jgi:hypothetical protein
LLASPNHAAVVGFGVAAKPKRKLRQIDLAAVAVSPARPLCGCQPVALSHASLRRCLAPPLASQPFRETGQEAGIIRRLHPHERAGNDFIRRGFLARPIEGMPISALIIDPGALPSPPQLGVAGLFFLRRKNPFFA